MISAKALLVLQFSADGHDALRQVVERGEVDVGQRGVVAATGDVRDAVRVAVGELQRVGVTGRHHDAAEVVDRVVERQQRGLLAAVRGHAGGEPGVRLVGQQALPPLRAERVEELLELAGHVAVAGRGAEQHGVGPDHVVGGRLGLVLGPVEVLAPRRVRGDGLVRRQLGDLTQAHLGAGLLPGLPRAARPSRGWCRSTSNR